MALNTLHATAWARFHDLRTTPIRPSAEIHCASEAADFIALCRDRPSTGRKFKAAGSHWSLSESTLSDDDAIETHWPGADPVPLNSGLAIDLFDLISDRLLNFMLENPPARPLAAVSDPCLSEGPIDSFFVHLKAGTRVYEAYSLLDGMSAAPTKLASELNHKLEGTPHASAYDGPWGFATLGGAGGQTVFGALTTGTHGGDFRQRPISDSVVAVHLVTDGGEHFWIEPARGLRELPIADDAKLHAKYDALVPGVRFDIIRDDDVFDSVVVGVGRFGVVASLVLRVVPQYCLLEHRRLENWSSVKALLNGPAKHHSYDAAFFRPGAVADQAVFSQRFGAAAGTQNRFLQIAINLSPHLNDEHRCGITQRWFHPSSGGEAIDPSGEVRGREERGTPGMAGLHSAYEPPDSLDKPGSSNGTFISKACASGSFVAGVAHQAAKEIETIITDNAVPAGGIAAAAIAVGGGGVALTIASLCAVLAAVALALEALGALLDALGDDTSLAKAVDLTIKVVESVPGVPDGLKVMILRAIFLKLFESEQCDRDFVAISYAVMDTHDYLDRSCYGNAESMEVFFDAARPDIYCAFVDAVLAFEAAQQEQAGRFTIGYISLRYVQGSRALIAPAQFNDTVAIEISGIRDAAGTMPFLKNAVAIARNPVFKPCFHWGQFNPLTRSEVEGIYDVAPAARLSRWRIALRKMSRGGGMDGFSSDFTRRTGLEPF